MRYLAGTVAAAVMVFACAVGVQAVGGVAEVPGQVVTSANFTHFAAFQVCFGPDPNPLCRIAFDCNNADGVIDLDDYAAFYARFTGQSVPPCGMALIPGGEFEMGDHHGDGESDELPVHSVLVNSFHMDVYEVTNQQYADALNWAWGQELIEVIGGVVHGAGGSDPYCDTYSIDDDSRIHWDGSVFTIAAGNEGHPMVEVSWYGAAAYANWRSGMDGRDPSYNLSTWDCDFDANGYRLPTEAEWEYAARGGEHDPYFRYPSGNTLDRYMANYWGSGDSYETGPPPWTTPVGYYDGGQTPPGSDMANGYGLYDVAGNSWEWTNDWYASDYYSNSPYDNPHGPATGGSRVLRGGSWTIDTHHLRCADRGSYGPDPRSSGSGFRLALDSE